jgi:hypothetical protein
MLSLIIVAALALQPAAPPPPPVVTPGPFAGPVPPPSDAVVLFDGTSLDGWTRVDGSPPGWQAEGKPGGVMTIVPGSGSIISRVTFADAQVHVEFMTPAPAAQGQDRGNSGVYLQGRYEIQVLDSYQNQTYPTGQCGAVYGQHVPLVNACRSPGEWQTYDIVFRAPRFNEQGEKTRSARVTVFHNGVLIHNDAEVSGPTGAAPVKETPDPGPLFLQDHGHPVQYRNIWIRRL